MSDPYRGALPARSVRRIRWGPIPRDKTSLALAGALLLALVVLFGAGASDHAECRRSPGQPGVCVLSQRLWGWTSRSRTVDLSDIAKVRFVTYRGSESHTERGKTELIDRAGRAFAFFSGSRDEARANYLRFERFFSDRSLSKLSLSESFSWVSAAYFLVFLGLGVWGLGGIVRLPTSIDLLADQDRHELQVRERWLGVPLRTHSVSLDGIENVIVEWKKGRSVGRAVKSAARLVLTGAAGRSEPVVNRFLPPSMAHERACEDLRRILFNATPAPHEDAGGRAAAHETPAGPSFELPGGPFRLASFGLSMTFYLYAFFIVMPLAIGGAYLGSRGQQDVTPLGFAAGALAAAAAAALFWLLWLHTRLKITFGAGGLLVQQRGRQRWVKWNEVAEVERWPQVEISSGAVSSWVSKGFDLLLHDGSRIQAYTYAERTRQMRSTSWKDQRAYLARITDLTNNDFIADLVRQGMRSSGPPGTT